MTKEQVLAKLSIDEEYYGKFGGKWLSSSDVGALLSEDPLRFKQSSGPKLVFVQGSYFHVAILEPHKLDKFIISKANTRHAKEYKEAAKGNILLLEKDVARLDEMINATMNDMIAYPYIRNKNVEYEIPSYTDIEGLPFKGKADIVNHNLKLVVDLKTTADVNSFEEKITMWNYDSQAYIYEKLFGYPFAWVAVCKRTHKVKVFENQDKYRKSGSDKVQRAAKIYREWFELD